jgi:hypothetical protein
VRKDDKSDVTKLPLLATLLAVGADVANKNARRCTALLSVASKPDSWPNWIYQKYKTEIRNRKWQT